MKMGKKLEIYGNEGWGNPGILKLFLKSNKFVRNNEFVYIFRQLTEIPEVLKLISILKEFSNYFEVWEVYEKLKHLFTSQKL